MQTLRELPGKDRLQSRFGRCLTLCLLALLMGNSLGACVESNQQVEELFPLFMQPSDLPSGWYYDKTAGGIGQWGNEERGVVSRYVQFRGSRSKDLLEVHVWQELVDFPDTKQAATAFVTIADEKVPTQDWVWPDQVQFDGQADQFLFVCLDLRKTLVDAENRYRATHWCNVVGLYGTVVSIISANIFEDQWLTFDDFQRLLTMTDARLAGAASLKQP